MDINEKIQKELFMMRDEKYRDFHSALMPDIEKKRVIGVRLPAIRKFSKKAINEKDFDIFLKTLPHFYYEENNLHAMYINQIKDSELCIKELDAFLPYVDNWATCDAIRPVCFKNNKKYLLENIKKWIKKEDTYTVRFAIEMLMVHFLDDDFDIKYTETVKNIKSDKYYINMMCAWYFQVALVKQYDNVISYLEERKLPKWVHNKTIQKSVESFRISDDKKEYLKTLKY